jgi:hypothetical protein
MADPQVPSRTTDHWHLPENPFLASAPHQPHGHVQQHLAVRVLTSNCVSRDRLSLICLTLQIPNMAGDDQQHAHRDGVPQPVANGAMQGQIQYPHQIDEPHYNSAQYHPAPLVRKTVGIVLSFPLTVAPLHSIRRFHTCTYLGM